MKKILKAALLIISLSAVVLLSACGKKASIKDLEITSGPEKTEYYTNEVFDPTGMTVTATLKDGTEIEISDYFYDTKRLTASDEYVGVYYGGVVKHIKVEVSSTALVDVSDIVNYEDGASLLVEGYFVGISESVDSAKSILIKSLTNDALFEMRGVAFEYTAGDRVKIFSTLTKTENESYLTFTSENTSKESTVVSSGNEIEYKLDLAADVLAWQKMKSYFNAATLVENTYVKIEGGVYGEFYIHKEATGDYFIHMNSAATDAAGIKPDGVRAIRVKFDALGAEWISSKVNLAGAESYPGAKVKGTLYGIYTGYSADFFDVNIADDGWLISETPAVDPLAYVTENHKIVREVAYAFHRKGVYIQYDQYNTRRNINPSPEAATPDNYLYLDCSSYVNAVYYEAFGQNIMPFPTTEKSPQTKVLTDYARDNQGAVDVIGYWVNSDYSTKEAKAELLAFVKSQLQIGDVLVFRRNSETGHVYVYVGDGVFLHSTGSSYEYVKNDPNASYDQSSSLERREGTVSEIVAEDIFDNKDSTRYMMASAVQRFALLRPLARGLTPTEKTLNRMTAEGVTYMKTSSVSTYSAVRKGDVISYTITLTNKFNSVAKNITVCDAVPEGTVLISASDMPAVEGSKLTWNIEIGKTKTYTIMYSVRVTSETPGAVIDASGATVNGVPLNKITHTVSAFSADVENKIIDEAAALVSSEAQFADPVLMVKTLYQNAIGNTTLDYATAEALLADLIDSENLTFKTGTAASELLVKDLYGGYDIKANYKIDNNRIRMVRECYLSVGDVIVAEYDAVVNSETGETKPVYNVFVYLGDGLTLSVSSADGKVGYASIKSEPLNNLLVTLLAYDRYAVIRPSVKIYS